MTDRILTVAIGNTAREAILGTGGLFRALAAARKTFLCINTEVGDDVLAPDLAHRGHVITVPIPAWVGEEPAAGRVDDQAREREFLLPDRPYLASLHGADHRAAGAAACIAARADLYQALVNGVASVAARQGNAPVLVDVVITAFGGRGTGSGALPVTIGFIDELRAAFAGQADLRVTLAVQLPTVRVDDIALYRTRCAALIAEVIALVEQRVPTDPDREAGGWRNRLPWDDFLLFSTGGGRAVRPRGVVDDVFEAGRFLAAVLNERLAGPAGQVLTALAPLRGAVVFDRDDGTLLPRVLSATGLAELVYEPEAAADYAAAWIERELYEAVRSVHGGRND